MQDSFKSCTTFPAALHVLQILAPDLIARLHEDYEVIPHIAHTPAAFAPIMWNCLTLVSAHGCLHCIVPGPL